MSDGNPNNERLLAIYDAAVKLAQRGYRVFPCRYGTKLPATTKGFHDATNDPLTVKAWFGGDRLWNLALATGKQPNGRNVVVFDLDVKGEHNGIDSWERANRENGTDPYFGYPIHATPTGGLHLFGASPVEVRCMTNFMPGVDIRGEGGYVLMPPSVILDRGTGEISEYGTDSGGFEP